MTTGPRDNDRLRAAREKMAQHSQMFPLRIVPKGIHAPAFRRTVSEIRSLETEIGLRRCDACGQHVIEGQNVGSRMKHTCSSCFPGVETPPAA